MQTEGMLRSAIAEAPVSSKCTNSTNNNDYKTNEFGGNSQNYKGSKHLERKKWNFTWKDIKWLNVIVLTSLHVLTVYGLVACSLPTKKTLLTWTVFVGIWAGLGVTAGAHRYWTHRSYKAKTPLKIILAMCYLTAGQNSIVQWVRDHRVHHKYSETDADPHNSKRGLFFSHVGWLMLKKHPEVITKGRQLDLSDLYSDPIVAFTERYFTALAALFSFIIPITVPIYLWNEELKWSIIAAIGRYVYVLNATWSVNSFAHFYGSKPYNQDIAPVENKIVSYVAFGEGWHNYHHVFPYDYRTAEIGGSRVNLTARFIDFFAKIGWAYDLKQPSESLVEATVARRGDGTHAKADELTGKGDILQNLRNSSNDSNLKIQQ